MTDLEERAGLIDGTTYRFTVLSDEGELLAGTGPDPEVDLRPAIALVRALPQEDRFLTVVFGRDGSEHRVEVHLRVIDEGAFPVALTRR
jgi:hypothetical protein